jgi:hypothetical protein
MIPTIGRRIPDTRTGWTGRQIFAGAKARGARQQRHRKRTRSHDDVLNQVRAILAKRQSQRYPAAGLAMHGLIESTVIWLAACEAGGSAQAPENFSAALVLAVELIDYPLFQRIVRARGELHLFARRSRGRLLRARLVQLVGIGDELLDLVNLLLERSSAA